MTDRASGSSPTPTDLPTDPPIIGITGPIGCGKSTVAAMLGELGGRVIDADDLARRATGPGEPALTAIRERFGDGVFAAPGVLDRGALAAVVFDDPAALHDLEAIVHPAVRSLVETELRAARSVRDPFVVVEAIKLVEGGLADRCAETWIVECDPDEQRDRLRGRGMGDDDVARRLEAQGADLADRLAERLGSRRHRRISASGSLGALRERVEDALADLLDPMLPGLLVGPVERPSGRR
jgi:dephospho-CoA kinase